MVLLVPDDKTDDDYKQWGAMIGTPSELGVHLKVGISYSDRPGPPHVTVEGIVGVPRPPEDDLERNMLACKLAELVETPDIAIFEFTSQIGWRLIKGGPFGVKLLKSETLRELDENEISNSVSLSCSWPLNEPVFQAKFAQSDDWDREYRANRYLRFESRAGLNRRYQDLLTNITILDDAGHVNLTAEKHWHQLFKHVIVEMFLRGEPPVLHNFDPTVKKAVLFPDKELCEQAANAIGKVQISGPILVKYGKAERIRTLYERGEVYMPPVSVYGDPDHNQAVHDQELAFSHYAVVANGEGYLKSTDFCANWDAQQGTDHRVLPLFHAPDAEGDQVTLIKSGGPDAWVYCISSLLTPRLFSDFDADACIVLSRDKFKDRIFDALRPVAGNKLFAHGYVHYADPFGAYQEPMHPPQVHLCYGARKEDDEQGLSPFGPGGELMRPPTVHFQKMFRFAYQREYRFVSYPPQCTKKLNVPIEFTLGPLSDIGELIIL